MSNKPTKKYSIGGIQVALWAGQKEGQYSVSVQKSYKPSNSDEWKQTGFFFIQEAAILATLLNQVVAENGVKVFENKPEDIEQNIEDQF